MFLDLKFLNLKLKIPSYFEDETKLKIPSEIEKPLLSTYNLNLFYQSHGEGAENTVIKRR